MALSVSLEHLAPLPRIEFEHRAIVDFAARLRTSLEEGASRREVGQGLSTVLDQVRAHFASEERLMATFAYPDRAGHAAEHRKLLEQLETVLGEFGSGSIGPSGPLGLFIERWIEQHIHGFDQRFEAFLHAAAASGATS